MKKNYCTQNDGDCHSCSLVNYGRDCRNFPLTKFNEWLDTFIEEKEIDLDEEFTLTAPDGTPNIMSYGVVIEHIMLTTKEEQEKIKDIIVKIDFKNGDVKHFFRHLAQAIVF